MSQISDCCQPCPSTTPPVNIPGTPGAPGAIGSAGQNAYSNITTSITLPIPNTPVSTPTSVTNGSWAVVGQVVVAGDGTNFGTFRVTSASAAALQLTWLNYPGDSAQGVTILSGAVIASAGVQSSLPNPLPILMGGTGVAATTSAQILAAIGAAAFGANSDITQLSGLTTPLSVAQGGTGANTAAAGIINLGIQAGFTTLVTGVKVVNTGVTITSASIILISLVTPGGTRTSFAGYKLTSVIPGLPGSGSFTITAISDTGAATLGACTDVVNFIIIG